MTIISSGQITITDLSDGNDGTITHTAWAYSADGTDGFTTVYPNLNLLDGTKDFSGAWTNSGGWTNDGTYKGLTVKKKTGQWHGIYKTFTAPKDGDYIFSAYIKASGATTTIIRHRIVNGVEQTDYLIGSNFDWRIDTVTVSLKTGQTAFFRYEISTNNADAILWNAGHKWEEGSTATPHMQSASEVTTADWPKYIGHYTDFTQADSTNPSDYTWGPMRGDDGKDGIAGKDGVGIQTTTITYVSSTSGTTAPTSGWTSAVPTVAAGSYLWTKTVWAYTDNTNETGYSVARMGLKGDKGDQGTPGVKGSDGTSGIIVSSVAPASPKTGQLWQDTSTIPQLVKKWTGSSWVIWELYAQNLKADTLETVTAKIGKIYNEFDNSSGGIDNKGTITIKDSVKVVYYLGNSSTTIDLVTSSSGQGLFTQYLPDKTNASKFKQSWYMPTGLYFTDSINNWNGQITAENVTLVPWKNLTYLSGYTTDENNPCQYRKIKNLDGSYTVQFKGQVKPVSGRFNATGEYLPLQVPAEIKPSINAFGIGLPDFTNIQSARLVVLASDGRVQLMVRGNATNYVSLDMMSYTL